MSREQNRKKLWFTQNLLQSHANRNADLKMSVFLEISVIADKAFVFPRQLHRCHPADSLLKAEWDVIDLRARTTELDFAFTFLRQKGPFCPNRMGLLTNGCGQMTQVHKRLHGFLYSSTCSIASSHYENLFLWWARYRVFCDGSVLCQVLTYSPAQYAGCHYFSGHAKFGRSFSLVD